MKKALVCISLEKFLLEIHVKHVLCKYIFTVI